MQPKAIPIAMSSLEMIKRIIFLIGNKFSLRDYRRFGIELLEKNGFKVEVWELMPVLYPGLSQDYSHPDLFEFHGLSVFSDRKKLYSRLSGLSKTDFVINFVTYRWLTLGIYKVLSRSHADYSIFCVASPYFGIKKIWRRALLGKLREIAGFRRLEAWKHLLIMKLPLKFLGIRPASLVLAVGEKCLECRRYTRLPMDKNTELLQIHALDYDLYLEEKCDLCDETPMAVFLDEFLPFHPDEKIFNRKSMLNADNYFKSLGNFFDLVEQKTGLKVVIAAHPRSNYDELPDYFNGRKCIRGKTTKLIRQSRFVLAHCSTTLKIANLFYKPVIFVTSGELDKSYDGDYIKESARSFRKNPVFVDRDFDIDWEQELKVNKKHYDSYREAYIKVKESDDLPFWQIVANRLKKGGTYVRV